MGRSEAIGDVTPKISENPPRSGSVSGSVETTSSLTGSDGGGAGRAGGGAGRAGGSAGRAGGGPGLAGGAEGRAGGNAGLVGGAGLGGGGLNKGGSSSIVVGASVMSEMNLYFKYDKQQILQNKTNNIQIDIAFCDTIIRYLSLYKYIKPKKIAKYLKKVYLPILQRRVATTVTGAEQIPSSG